MVVLETKMKRKAVKVDSDFAMPDGYSLSVSSHGYAVLSKYAGEKTSTGKSYKYHRLYLHRYITNAPKGLQVDHINGDKLDNRKENLRLCDNAQNNQNKPAIKGVYKGVYYSRGSKCFVAQITKNRKVYSLGSYDDPHEAANAYNLKAIELHGEYALLNIIAEELPSVSTRRKPVNKKRVS